MRPLGGCRPGWIGNSLNSTTLPKIIRAGAVFRLVFVLIHYIHRLHLAHESTTGIQALA